LVAYESVVFMFQVYPSLEESLNILFILLLSSFSQIVDTIYHKLIIRHRKFKLAFKILENFAIINSTWNG